ncbi:glucosamine-6-phosphate deaminase [Pseudonocardia phyllosphaerae]|uniref:glucosamine-6-phosphate deaminase n=1 Tax=Pseudonocardia phyllosphaerae TaxID=3390502 RepID=UPI00397B8716
MDVLVLPGPDACGRAVADAVTAVVAPGGPVTLGLATGSSPLPAYRELVRRHRADGLSFAAAQAFLLDEYLGLPAGHPQTYRQVIRRELTGHLDIDPDAVHGPDGTAPDPERAAARYEQLLARSGPVDVQILGIGTNGHIGFNEPGTPPSSLTRVATLTARTRADNARFFDRPADVPHRVITQGLGTIRRARHLVLVATGAGKAAAVAAAVQGPVTPDVPASVLQAHPHCTLVLDDAAAGGLHGAVTGDRHPAGLPWSGARKGHR